MPTTAQFREMAGREPITMLTAYDAPTAAVLEEAGVDAVLVGDSVGNAMLGYESTLPVTVDQMESHTAAVVRATDEALVIADMPFLSVGVSEAESVRNAGRMVKEAGADAVKLESGEHTVDLTGRLVDLGVPVMAHLGLTPQRVNELGGYTRQGTTRQAAAEILELARAHEEAGAFALVLEHVPANVAAQVTDALEIPTIGIGAGSDCDGQVLVSTDVFGLSETSPPFSKRYADLRGTMREAAESFREEVESGTFPAAEHAASDPDLDDLPDASGSG